MRKTILALLAICSPLILSPPTALAQFGLEDIVTIDVLEGGMTAKGTYQAALRLTLSDGWKTYWRAPGDAGIPPELTYRGSRNVGATSITWPTPNVFDQDGVQTIGYKKQLVLPIEITPRNKDRAVHLRGEIQFGVCKDVCVPATLNFDQALRSDAPRNPTIVAAIAKRPFSRDEAKVSRTTCRVEPAKNGMRLTASITMPSAGGAEVAVIEPGNPKLWASPPRTSRRGNVLTATSDLVHIEGKAYALDRSAVRITVLGKNHAVDILGCTPD